MNDLRTAAQQALEALDGVAQWVEQRPATHPWDAWQKVEPAITALRAALAQQAEPVEGPETVDQRVGPLVESALQAVAEKIGDQCAVWYGIGARDVEEVLREAARYGLVHGALAEPVEPVGAAGLFTLAHLWAQQCYFKGLGRPCDIDSARGAFEQALKAYTAPPQRKPLTEEMEARCPYAKANPTLRGAFFDGWLNSERAHGITDPQIEDRLARHGIPMPEGDPK